MHHAAVTRIGVILATLIVIGCSRLVTTRESSAAGQAAEVFQATWTRTDGPVRDGLVSRTWVWGNTVSDVEAESYLEAPGGVRLVQYFDKSRMELTNPGGDPQSPWYVTNGLLAVELITGRVQLGDSQFELRSPAQINVAGDIDDPMAPTYATFGILLTAPPLLGDAPITQRISREGVVKQDAGLAAYGVTAAHLVRVPDIDHQIASPFWAFMQVSGLVSSDGALIEAPLFTNPFFGTGLPISEAYWTTVRVGGIPRDVLLQCFERRCLTYTPSNPAGWQVETGNVGQHYRLWRQSVGSATPTPERDPTATPTQTSSPTPTSTGERGVVTIGPGAVDNWTRSIVRDIHDRVWIVAPNNNAAYRGVGPGELHIYRATTAGIPTGFSELEAARQYSAGAGPIPFADAAIDGDERLHIAWLDRAAGEQPVMYGVFDLPTESWTIGPSAVASTHLAGFGGSAGQGGISVAIGPDGTIRIAYCAAGDHTRIEVITNAGGNWSQPEIPVPVAGAFVWHPALAVGPADEWYLAVYDATSRHILAAQRVGTEWIAQRVTTEVLGPESIDQGPALLVTPQGIATIAYLDSSSFVRVSRLIDGRWQDAPLGGDYFTHAPGLGLLADGTLIIAGHDEHAPPNGINVIVGRDSAWGAWQPVAAIHADGSEVFRWAGAFSTPGATADLVFFDEDSNDDGVFDDQTLYYLSIPLDP